MGRTIRTSGEDRTAMSPKVEVESGPEALSIGELCELGRRLTTEMLEDLGFLRAVEQAEHEFFWRVTAAAELLQPLDGCRPAKLADRAESSKAQIQSPERGTATVRRISARTRGRRLPQAGSVITKHHRFQGWNVPPEGGRSQEFRFVVINPRGRLILLGDDQDAVYGSPSAAARAATGNRAAQGWSFFGVD